MKSSSSSSSTEMRIPLKQAILVLLMGIASSIGICVWTGHLNAQHPFSLSRAIWRAHYAYERNWRWLSHVVRLRDWRWLHKQVQPFFDDPQQTPYAQLFASMEAQSEALTQEWMQFAKTYSGAPLIGNVLPDHAGYNQYVGDRWSTLWLRMLGLESEVFHRDFPLLRKLTQNVAFVGISVTHENTFIDIHRGYNPLILRYLFGLQVPEGCNQEDNCNGTTTTTNTTNEEEKPMFLLVNAPDEQQGEEWAVRYPQHQPSRVPNKKNSNKPTVGGLKAHWEQGKGILFDDLFEHGVVNLCGTRAVVWLDLPRWDLQFWGLQSVYNFVSWRLGYLLPYTKTAIRRTNDCFASAETARQCNQEDGLIVKGKKQ
ncbi:expressed unknown protein [Seminavis robusta]|uniref:Aspartyl/asparaginy/proline hydroxylase domain-containing protein n=1 Tax=Seminavis robusta TaxID=568900 RepID=A0A9N8EZH1_9STRA|nr:expressed unknown protein [Seminavis robusta]|eukprot:Sro2739_g335980.1 n/a (369) ;mRNA; r:475-1581